MKNLKKGNRDIVELAGKAEKLAKRLHPTDDEASERHAIDAFPGALDHALAMEVQIIGHRRMEDVVAAARRIKKIMEEQADSKMERLVNAMQDQIRILKKDLKEAHEQIAAHKASQTSATAMTTTAATASQAPPSAPARHIYQDYDDGMNYHRPPRRLLVPRPPRCFLCGEEGHFVVSCPARLELQRLLRQQARAGLRAPP